MSHARPAAFATLASLVLLLSATVAPLQVQAAGRCELQAIEVFTGPLPVDVPNKISTDDDPFPNNIGYNPPSRYVNARGSVETTSDGCGVKVNVDAFGRNYRTTVGFAADIDQNGDGMGDNWARDWEKKTGQILQALVDSDDDGLLNVGEFRWDLIPICLPPATQLLQNCHDHESDPTTGLNGDDWTDGSEVAYWNDPGNDFISLGTGVALLDPDRLIDTDGDRRANINDTDSDNDGLLDGTEYNALGTYPELQDSDCAQAPCTYSTQSSLFATNRQGSPGTGDGLNDSAELTAWSGVSYWAVMDDFDGDGILNNLLDADADGDGLRDGQEFNCQAPTGTGLGCTRPDKWDTDRDGLLDGADTTLTPQDSRYARFTGTGIQYTDSATGRTFLGEATHQSDPRSPDTDGDGMPDGYEAHHELSPLDATDASRDADSDDYANLQEYIHAKPTAWTVAANGVYWGGTVPTDWDTDGDGTPDGWEIQHSFNPQSSADAAPDSDRDGLTNLQEYVWARPAAWSEDSVGLSRAGTNPRAWDTDADLLPDGWEAASTLNPRDGQDAAGDVDLDGLANLGEYQYNMPPAWNVPAQGVYAGGTVPTDPDTDGDELRDGPEVLEFQTNPFSWDTDGDALPDAWEASHKFKGATIAANPLASDASTDGDGDSFTASWCTTEGNAFTNRAEYTYKMPTGWDSRPTKLGGDGVWTGGTSPNVQDSEGDGFLDGYEVCAGTDASQRDLLPDSDQDQDGLGNYAEAVASTDLSDADTDGDGACDGGRGAACVRGSVTNRPGEVNDYHTNPLAEDTDADAWQDGPESSYWDAQATGRVPDSDSDGTDNLHEADSDNDGLTDYQEYQSLQGSEGSDPSLVDTDGDGLADKVERDGWSFVVNGVTRFKTSNPSLQDTDNDGLPDAEEKVLGTDPRLGDSDGDARTDAQEGQGWAIIVNGQSRMVNSNPTRSDTDSDALNDGAEFSLGTDPRLLDTDVDGLGDGLEDEDHDGASEEGETNPLSSDSDSDGLLDGAETLTLNTDALAVDSDEDGLPDGNETQRGTNPLNPDTDGDFLPDGEEVGAASGGDSRRLTNPLNPDTDGDGFKDGEEAYFYDTNPLAADSDCDAQWDGSDPNPYDSNLPPGEMMSPAERAACAGGTSPQAAPMLLPMSQAEATNDIGLLVFDRDGTITVFARPPTSETPVAAIQVLVDLVGHARVDEDGTTEAATGHLSGELQPLEEPAQDGSGAPFTHAVRMALPEGMTDATSATYALTIMDRNLNAATYTGEATGFEVEEVAYQNDTRPGDDQDYNDPSGATLNATGYDYVRSAITGGVDPEEESAAMLVLPGQPVVPGSPQARGMWLFRITQPDVPALVGKIVDGAIHLAPPVHGGVPFQYVLYTNTSTPVDPDDYGLYMQAGWFNTFAKGLQKVVQATTKAWSATVQVASTVDKVVGAGFQVAKKFTLQVYNEVANPRGPAAQAARFLLDVGGVGDVISIVEGVRNGDWVQIGLGVAGLAMTAVPVLKTSFVGAKVALRAAQAAGAGERVLSGLGRYADDMSRLAFGNPGSAASIAQSFDRVNDGVRAVAKGGKAELNGWEALAEVRGVENFGFQGIPVTKLETGFAAKQVATKTQEGAQTAIRNVVESSSLQVEVLAKVERKAAKLTPEMQTQVVDGLVKLRAVDGAEGVASSALKMAAPQAKGHAYTIIKATDNVGKPGHSLHFPRTLASGKTIRPDETFLQDGIQFYREYKNYDGVFSLSTFNKQQLKNYAQMVDEFGGKVQYVVKNGQVSKGVKDLVKELNDALPAKTRIELLNDAGMPII